MATLSISIDAQTETGLRRLVGEDGEDVAAVAARLLARAVRAARPRIQFDAERIREANSAYAEEDDVLADSAIGERASLLLREDRE